MTSQPSSISPAAPRPWERKHLSYGAKIGFMLLSAVLFMVMLISLIMIYGVWSTYGQYRDAGADQQMLTVSTLVALVCAAGLFTLFPRLASTTGFTPRYTPPAATVRGEPFDVRHQEQITKRVLIGKGRARFDPEGLTLHGNLESPKLVQLLLVVTLTFVPLLLFGIGFGTLFALLVARYAGRKTITRVVPYGEIRDLEVVGTRVSFSCNGVPGRAVFVAASVDGERLYRELAARFPAAMGGWAG
ncbi:MAG TPA: hypothetical protein VFS21_10955 [Roseiflexaceae bacterium]|nr:hypothetical protein [Roseiflexaceae bacterium]